MRHRRSDLIAVVVVLAVAAVMFAVRLYDTDGNLGPERSGFGHRKASGDTYWYALQAQQFAGIPEAVAKANASKLICTDAYYQIYPTGKTSGSCSQYTVSASPRYRAIFTSRPMWPILLAPFVQVFGLIRGMVILTGLTAILAALAVLGALRRLGCSSVAAGTAGVAFSLLPTGYWASRLLPEGAVLATLVVALYAACRLAQGRFRALVALLPALAILYALKPANGAALSAALLAAGLVMLPLRRGRLAALTLAGVGALGAVGWVVVSNRLGLPSFNETVQDMVTKHFSRRDKPDPVGLLRQYNALMWPAVPRWLFMPHPFVLAVPAALLAAWRLRRAGIVIGFSSLAAVTLPIAHPLLDQYDRLIVSVWLVVILALALGIDAVRSGELVPKPPRFTPTH